MPVIDATARKNVPLADVASVDVLMRDLLGKNQGESGAEEADRAGMTAQPSAPRRDFDMAAELLDRASQAFNLLINRCQILEHDLNDASERAEARAAEQEATIEQWKRLASGFKAQIDASEQAVAALKARCDAAEARAVKAEQAMAKLERASAQAAAHAAAANQLSTKLHDKVISAFGIGSRAHPVLEAVATRIAAE